MEEKTDKNNLKIVGITYFSEKSKKKIFLDGEKEFRGYSFTWNNYNLENKLKLQKWIINHKNIDYNIEEKLIKNVSPCLCGYFWNNNCIKVKTLLNKFSQVKWIPLENGKKSYTNKEKIITPQKDIKEILKQKILEKYYSNVIWKDWQQNVLDIINKKPDSRTIYWFLDREGNQGKSFLCRYIECRYNAIIGYGDNLIPKIINWINLNKKHPKIILYDIPRSNNDKIDFVSIENIKNGNIYDNNSGSYIFKHPHVIVFSNKSINTGKFSEDRLKIVNITNKDWIDKMIEKSNNEITFNVKDM